MFIIDNKLSKEENLGNARNIETKAKDLIKRYVALMDEAKQLSPAYYYPSKRERTKNNEHHKVIERIRQLTQAEYDVKSTYEYKERIKKDNDEKIAKEEKAKEVAKQEQEYLNDAIKYCLENNLVFGKDFTTENAIRLAVDMAFHKEVEQRIKDGGYFDFNGQNCDGPCSGWDGVSHRCDCGNRRVSWESSGGFKDLYVYAEAY